MSGLGWPGVAGPKEGVGVGWPALGGVSTAESVKATGGAVDGREPVGAGCGGRSCQSIGPGIPVVARGRARVR